MKYNFYTLLILLISIQGGIAQKSQFKDNSKKFKGKYEDYIGEDEQAIKSWYHYVTTKTSDNKYIARVFYPQTKQMLSETTYKKKSFKVKHGPATEWSEMGHLSSEGFYENNKKHGYWRKYYWLTGNRYTEGNYANGIAGGEWKYYDRKGRLKETCHFEHGVKNGPFILYDSLNQILNQGVYRADTIFTQTHPDTARQLIEGVDECLPYLAQCHHIQDYEDRKKCSDEALIKFIQDNLKYPKEARRYGIEGRVFAQFTVDVDGSIQDVIMLRTYCDQIKNEVLRVIDQLPQWRPATQLGKPVKVLYTLPFTFRLE